MKTTKIIYLLKQLLESLEIENQSTKIHDNTMYDNIIERRIKKIEKRVKFLEDKHYEECERYIKSIGYW